MRALIALALALVAACGDDAGLMPDAATAPDAPDGGPDAPTVDTSEVPAGCVAERTTADRPDDTSLDQVRVLYVVPSDGVDAAHDTSGKICNSIRGVATWFHDQSGSYLRLDTAQGLVDIGFVRLSKTDVEMRGSDANNNTIATGIAFVRERIELELEGMGLIAENKLYAVYYDGSSSWSCGGGAYPPLIVDRVGAMYLDGLPTGQGVTCGETRPWGLPSLMPNYIDYGMLHETVHSMGIVSSTSPHQHSTGHVFDSLATNPNRDLMYSPRMGQADPGWGIDSGLVIDIGSDDYFGAGTADLSTMSLLSPLPAAARRPNGW